MKLTVENTKDKDVKVYDNMGREIKRVQYYDTETCEITFLPVYVNSKGEAKCYSDDNGVMKVTTIWTGSYVTIDGVRVERDYCGAV